MTNISKEIKKYRKTSSEIEPLILNRWSSRAMSGEYISDEELMSLFEAARWAPSSNNNQPWRFIYTKKYSDEWNIFFSFLADANKLWAHNAAALIVIISKKTFDYNDKPSKSHSFDAGAAWENLALEAINKGLLIRGIGGFDYETAKKILNIPDDYEVEIMVAVGKPGSVENLHEMFKDKNIPSLRKPISEIVMKGKFIK